MRWQYYREIEAAHVAPRAAIHYDAAISLMGGEPLVEVEADDVKFVTKHVSRFSVEQVKSYSAYYRNIITSIIEQWNNDAHSFSYFMK